MTGAVDPYQGARLLKGSRFESNQILGDRIIYGRYELTPQSQSGWRLGSDVERALRKAQRALLLYVPEPVGYRPVYDIGLPAALDAWRSRLKAQYIRDDGLPPDGYDGTALVAHRWEGINQPVFVFEVACW
jgi:hypothetical protein